MFAVSSNSIRNSLAAAAVSVTALLGAAGVPNAQQLTLEATRPANLVVPAPAPGQAHVFTSEECTHIRVAATLMFNRVGANNLSRQSMVRFIAPDGQRATCDGSRVISWRTQRDAATFNSIRGLLLGPSANNISLERAGVVLASTPVASLRLQ